MTVFEKDIAIDMGTASTMLFEQGKGIVARESGRKLRKCWAELLLTL